jgi:hypothetical protein
MDRLLFRRATLMEFQFAGTRASKIRETLRSLGFTDEDLAKDTADGVALTALGMRKADEKYLELEKAGLWVYSGVVAAAQRKGPSKKSGFHKIKPRKVGTKSRR